MWWNKLVKESVGAVFSRRGVFAPLLCPVPEVHEKLFGRYRFHMDLSLGRLQRILYLKPENYELETQTILRELCRPGSTVLDIGANSGYFSLLMANAVGPSGRVFSFEPLPVSFSLLKQNIQANNLTNIYAIQVALSNKRGEAVLHVHPTNDGGHSLGMLKESTQGVTVPTQRLDDFLAEQGVTDVAVIKIDVEGAEYMVFEGAGDLLSRPNAPAIVCEVSDENQQQMQHSEKELRQALYALGYKSFWLEGALAGSEFDTSTPVQGLVNVLFKKSIVSGHARTLPPNDSKNEG